MKTGNSLSGQNADGRIAGAGSSPASPTKSQRTKLWKELRKLDRKCAVNPYVRYVLSISGENGMRRMTDSGAEMFVRRGLAGFLFPHDVRIYQKYDLRRKEIRAKLKSHGQT